jgi:hypothetical protein
MRPRLSAASGNRRHQHHGRAKPLDASGGGGRTRAAHHPHQERHRTWPADGDCCEDTCGRPSPWRSVLPPRRALRLRLQRARGRLPWGAPAKEMAEMPSKRAELYGTARVTGIQPSASASACGCLDIPGTPAFAGAGKPRYDSYMRHTASAAPAPSPSGGLPCAARTPPWRWARCPISRAAGPASRAPGGRARGRGSAGSP